MCIHHFFWICLILCPSIGFSQDWIHDRYHATITTTPGQEIYISNPYGDIHLRTKEGTDLEIISHFQTEEKGQDFVKYGIWPDAYYVGTNESSCAVYALERAQMLLGLPARSIRADAPDHAGFGFQALTTSSCSGEMDPTGQPNYFMRHRDDEVHNAGSNNPTEDYLEIWTFDIDWVNTANSAFTGPIDIAIAEIDSDLNGLTAFSCFQQPGTGVELDPLREVVMFPVYYRKFSDHESMLGTLVTDVDTTDHGGIRWFELRKTTGAWSLYQEGTYAPDADSRWMSSAAMDQKGNIAIGYNVSSTNTFQAYVM